MIRRTFSQKTDSDPAALAAALPPGLRLGAAREERRRRTWIDTFDWRLHRNELCAFFVRRGRCWELTLRDREGRDAGGALLDAAPGMGPDLPPGPLADRLAPAIGIRRLLPQVTVASRRTVALLLDDLDKTIGRLAIERRSAFAPDSRRPAPLDDRVVLTALRGFDREVEAAARALVETGVLQADERRELDSALAAIGRATGDYSPKPRFALTASQPGAAALAAIYQHLLDTIRRNEPGLVARLDEEFLHDYRVAVRRTRSALAHFDWPGDSRPRDWGRRFFADLGRRTGAARDLDILLLELPGYAARLPAKRRPGLATMAARLTEDRAAEYARIGRWLASRSYARGVERWQREIDRLRAAGKKAGTEAGEQGVATMGDLAADAISVTAARVFKQAKKVRRVGGDGADAAVHRLRIRCKKLRYVLEFSRSLTPGGEVRRLVAALKKLQTVLGTFNDLVVHTPRLAATASREPADPELTLATGWLLAELDRRHQKARARVDATVRRFQREAPPLLERLLARLPRAATGGRS